MGRYQPDGTLDLTWEDGTGRGAPDGWEATTDLAVGVRILRGAPKPQVNGLVLAIEVSVLEAKRLGHRAVLRLSWLLLVASVALSILLQVAVAHPPWSAT